MSAQTCERCGRPVGWGSHECARDLAYDVAFTLECCELQVARLERKNAALRAEVGRLREGSPPAQTETPRRA